MKKYILLHREVIPVTKLQGVTTYFTLKNTRKKINAFLNVYNYALKIQKWPNASTMQYPFYFTLWDICIRSSKFVFCGFFKKYIYLKFANTYYFK